MKDRIILDLCGGTGAWSKPYKDAGYDVRVITLPEHDVLTYHPPEGVYGILAAPPCTEFSVAKGNKPRDLESAMHIVTSCLRVVWKSRLEGSLNFWALENPRGLLRQFLGLPAYTFEHWEFGTPQIKPTDLWGYFNKPTKKVKNKPENLTVKYGTRINGRGWGSPKAPDEYKHLNLNRAAIRAITPATFAQAFYKSNK